MRRYWKPTRLRHQTCIYSDFFEVSGVHRHSPYELAWGLS